MIRTVVRQARMLGLLALVVISAVLSAGCATPREPSRTPRTAIEQLLLSQAIERSVAHLEIPLPSDSAVFLDVSGFGTDPVVLQSRGEGVRKQPNAPAGPMMVYGPSADLLIVRDLVAARLGSLGLRLQTREEEAGYRVRVLVRALGTEQGENFFGMPPVQSVLLPFSLPELTLYRAQNQSGYVRYSIDVFDAGTGRLVRSTPTYIGSAYYNQYTVFFFLTFRSTDVVTPP